jgi:outer membrane murein-binding lipoprotein Lpp
MPNNLQDTSVEKSAAEKTKGHGIAIGALTAGLVIALAGNVFLLSREGQLRDELARTQQETQAKIAKISEATTTLLDQRLEGINDQIRGANEAANAAVKQARTETHKQSAELSRRLDDQQKQVSVELVELKDQTKTNTGKINDVSTDVNGVKTEVSGVKTDVNGVKADVASTQSELEKTASELKRAMGDMGVMSGLIATNSKDLVALRALGERNYFEFDVRKKNVAQKVGDLTITLKKTDPKRNKYTVEILADDKRVEKKDKTINEPVQLYVAESRQPYEVVVNKVGKDEVAGYLSTPKVKMARR